MRKNSNLQLLFCQYSFFLVPLVGVSQDLQRDVNPFPITIDGIELKTPFQGGFNKPVPQFVDWDSDGRVDLFISDEDGRLQYFQNIGTREEVNFMFQTRAFQGLNVGRWFCFFDYDKDLDLDLMGQTLGTPGVTVYQNMNGELVLRTRELITDHGYPVDGGQIVIPTVADINNDGWDDFFVGSVAGTVVYYQSLDLSDDLPLFHLESDMFQDIYIVWIPGRGDRHGANALEFFDIDNDQDFDLFWGDLYQPGLFFLENIGTALDPFIPESLLVDTYPEPQPVETAGFNVPRLVDIDFDGDGDLFVGVQSGMYGTDNTDNFWYYENVGTQWIPDFQFQTKNYIETLDMGAYSIPTIADIDDDGDLDLFVGHQFDPNKPGWAGSVYFFRNTGTSSSPSFVLEDSTFFDVSIGNNLAPSFADVDCDGDLDAYVGDWNGKIHFFLNIGTPQDYDFQYIGEIEDIDLTGHSTPVFGDVDNDGDMDLFVGDKNGKVHVWSNSQGCGNVAMFTLVSDDFFPDDDLGENIVPAFYDVDSDGDPDLLVGNEAGDLFFIWNLGEWEWEVEKVESLPYCGMNLAPYLGDINSDGTLDLFVGSQLGGLQFLTISSGEINIREDLTSEDFSILKNFPNPFNGRTTIFFQLESDADVSLTIYEVLGREVKRLLKGRLLSGSHKVVWDATEFPSGIYFYRLIITQEDPDLNLSRGRYNEISKMILLK